MAGKIQTYDAGNLALRPTETGVEARAGTARRVGAFYNQQAGAEEMLARETDRLASLTDTVGRETSNLGSEKGAAISAAGRAIGSGISEAGDAAVKYLDHQQISQGSASWAKMLQDVTDDWNNRLKNANPNDPHVATDFMDSLNDRLSKFQENGFYTENAQKWAEGHVEALRQHMVEKTSADMSSLAGEAVKVNHQQTVNSLSATVHGDPTSLDFALAGLKSSAEGVISSSPNLRGTDVAKVRGELQQSGAEAIVKSAAVGYIEKTGQMPPWATDPKYSKYINGAELQMFEKQAKTQAKANAYYEKQIEVSNRQLADLQVHQGATKLITDNVKTDPQTGRPIISPQYFKDALELARKNPDAPSAAATVRTMLDWGEHQQNLKAETVVSDPTVRQGLTDRLFDPNNPTTRIDLMKAQVAGKISNSDFTSMERLVTELETSPLKGPIWQDTVGAVKGELILSDVGLPGKDIAGESNYAKWAQTFIPDYLAKSRAGTLPPNALDVKDPTSMISQSMAPFKRSVQQRAADYLATLGGVAPTPGRTVGEVPVPPALGGVAALQYNAAKRQWRDQTTGTVYDSAGQPVAK